MTTIQAKIGTDTVKIGNVKDADLIQTCMTPHMREELKEVLREFVAKASCTSGSLVIGDKVIEVGLSKAEGTIPREEIRTDFAAAVREKVGELMSDYLQNAGPVDYSKMPQGSPSPEPVAKPARPVAGAPAFDPMTGF